MSVTVIIVNWNGGEWLAKCLQTLTEQTVQAQRILVVDNASSDNSAACVKDFPAVELLAMDSNLGFAVANNRALKLCDTEFVALLNPDAFAEPNWLESLLAAAKNHPEMAVFGSRQLSYQIDPLADKEILDGIGDVYHLSGLVWRKRYGAKQQASDLIAEEIFSACAAAVLYRREAIEKVGGFDEDYFCYVEDVDLGFRLRLQGYKALYVPEAVVQHLGSVSSGGQESDFSVYHGYRNLFWTFIKNMPGYLFYLLLPLHLLMYLIFTLRFMLRGQAKVILRAERDALKGLPLMLKKRTEIQSQRVVAPQEIYRVLNKHIPVKKGVPFSRSAKLLSNFIGQYVKKLTSMVSKRESK